MRITGGIKLTQNYSEISSRWLTGILRENGYEADVKGFSVEKVGTGQLGETRRFHLRYEKPSKNLPSSLIGKFPSDDDTAAHTGRNMGFYKSEAMFYKELAFKTQIKAPRPLFAELDDDNNFSLILEDLFPAEQGDHMVGCSVESARKALKEAALLHSAFWNDKELELQEWLYIPTGAQGFYTTELVMSSWKHFSLVYGKQLDPEVFRACEKFIAHHESWNGPRTKNRCFSHNDFRVDNMLFRDGEIYVVDWQTSNYLGVGMDSAYFLGSALSRDLRKNLELELLEEYHKVLLENGVKNYTFDELLMDYRHYSLAAAVVAIAATVIVKQTERGDALFLKMVEDSIYQAIDNDALDLL